MATKARSLPPGGTIGVPAPASPYFNRSELLRGVEWWESKGYRVKLGKSVDARRMYTAGDPETRARDVTDMFADDEVDVVHCLQGGYGSA
ncbi:MAG: LD-carboxypeptidase, partial [Actinomycetota bacterium]